jgi:hypothetical protein
VFAPVGGDAPGHQQGLLGAVAAEGLEHGIDKQVLDVDVGQAAGDEGLVVLPQPVGDLRNGRLGDQQLAGGIAEGILDIAGGQSPGIHLGDQSLEHLTVALQKAHQRRPKRLSRSADLRDSDINESFCGAQPATLITVARPELTLITALVAAPATKMVVLLTFQQLLDHQPRHHLNQRRDDIALTVHTPAQQRLELLASDH